MESISYIDSVLQVQDIDLVESVQRGMRTPAFDQGRIVYDAGGSGLSEHGVHHFHGLVLDATGPGGSDRLIDALVAWGDLDAIRARIQDHLDAGADHVALHVITADQNIPRQEWAHLSAILPGLTATAHA